MSTKPTIMDIVQIESFEIPRIVGTEDFKQPVFDVELNLRLKQTNVLLEFSDIVTEDSAKPSEYNMPETVAGAGFSQEDEKKLNTRSCDEKRRSTIDFVIPDKFNDKIVEFDQPRPFFQPLTKKQQHQLGAFHTKPSTQVWMSLILILSYFETRDRVFSNQGIIMQTRKARKLCALITSKFWSNYSFSGIFL